MSIIDRITTVFLPTVSIFRRKQRAAAIEQGDEHSLRQTNKDQGDRIFELEKTVKHLLQTLMRMQMQLQMQTANQNENQNLPALMSENGVKKH